MKFANSKINMGINMGIKSINCKYLVALIIFVIGIVVLLYNIYIQSFQTTLIESFGSDMMGEGSGSGLDSKILKLFSSFFDKKCLPGCVSPTILEKEKCNIINENNKSTYDCPWICDTKKFDEKIKSNPELQQQLAGYNKCSPDNEKKDCGSCVPHRWFDYF